ncbi:MAG: hypothetical protein JSS28_08075 [Proteobacteria bacterium]|nr:hypothetical protein [Pseudomonadota bacterium]
MVDSSHTRCDSGDGSMCKSRSVSLSILLVACVLPMLATAQEFCGIDDIFNNGFEAQSFVPTSQLPGGVMSPGLTQDITGTGTLNVAITSPGSGAATGNSNVDVVGTYTGPVNTGIVVNGVSGYAVNGQFVVPNVPLTSGANTLNVTATILPNSTATNSGSITQSGPASAVTIQANHPTDYAPAPITFTYGIGTLPSGNPVQTVTINFTGSGGPNFSGSSLTGAPSSYSYSSPGIYTATLSVQDTMGNLYTGTTTIAIQNLAAQRGMMCDIYGYLKNRLNAQDATNAANAFQQNVRSNYQSLFTAFGTNMPTVAQSLGVIVSGMLGQGFADMLIVRDNAGAQTRAGFPLRVTQGADGVWRISEM